MDKRTQLLTEIAGYLDSLLAESAEPVSLNMAVITRFHADFQRLKESEPASSPASSPPS